MRPFILFMLWVAAGAALAADWEAISFTRSDARWEVRRASMGRSAFDGRPAIVAELRRVIGDKAEPYTAFVPVDQCGKSSGELHLAGPDRAETTVWYRGSGMASFTIANALCAMDARGRR